VNGAERIRPAGAPGIVGGTAPAGRVPRASRGGGAFGDVLATKLAPSGEPLKFSGHALDRIAKRGIGLDQQSLARLEQGVARAAGKGSRDSLVLLDGTAFVVSVRNRTVVTAVDGAHMRDQVFTNIDSAVIA
jgi:flagellar operon protein